MSPAQTAPGNRRSSRALNLVVMSHRPQKSLCYHAAAQAKLLHLGKRLFRFFAAARWAYAHADALAGRAGHFLRIGTDTRIAQFVLQFIDLVLRGECRHLHHELAAGSVVRLVLHLGSLADRLAFQDSQRARRIIAGLGWLGRFLYLGLGLSFRLGFGLGFGFFVLGFRLGLHLDRLGFRLGFRFGFYPRLKILRLGWYRRSSGQHGSRSRRSRFNLGRRWRIDDFLGLVQALVISGRGLGRLRWQGRRRSRRFVFRRNLDGDIVHGRLRLGIEQHRQADGHAQGQGDGPDQAAARAFFLWQGRVRRFLAATARAAPTRSVGGALAVRRLGFARDIKAAVFARGFLLVFK